MSYYDEGGGRSYACAPSDKAMKGSKDQSFSVAGSVPSSPMQSSISGPLDNTPLARLECSLNVMSRGKSR